MLQSAAPTEAFDDWRERQAEGVSIAEVVIDGVVFYACAKDENGRVVDIWDPEAVESAPFRVEGLN